MKIVRADPQTGYLVFTVTQAGDEKNRDEH
jgi:hypothetical protein